MSHNEDPVFGVSAVPVRTISQFPRLDDPRVVFLAEYARDRMRDDPALNRLTAGFDHSIRHLKWAVFDTLSDWASTPPFIGQDLNLILERGWFSLFTKGVIITCLESLGILHMRNHLAYSDGGMNVQTENPRLIQSWLQMAKSEYENKKQRVLIAANIEGALGPGGGLHSELFFHKFLLRSLVMISGTYNTSRYCDCLTMLFITGCLSSS